MPGNIKDEKKWDEAKKIVKKQKGSIDNYWALVSHIYQEMGGKYSHSSKSELSQSISKISQIALKYRETENGARIAKIIESYARPEVDEYPLTPKEKVQRLLGTFAKRNRIPKEDINAIYDKMCELVHARMIPKMRRESLVRWLVDQFDYSKESCEYLIEIYDIYEHDMAQNSYKEI